MTCRASAIPDGCSGDPARPLLRGLPLEPVQHDLLYRTLDRLPLMISLFDAAGTFLWVNRYWVELLGWTLEDTRAPGFLDRAIVDREVRRHIGELLGLLEGDWHDVQLRTRAGEVVTASWTGVALLGGVHLGIGRDVSELQRAADQLRENEARYRLMIERSDHVFFYTHDLAGHFEYVSPSVQAVLGYTPTELIGRHYTQLLPADAVADVVAQTGRALSAAAATAPYVTPTRHRDGRTVRMEITESPVIRAGVITGMQGFARDVTQLKQLEEQVQHAQKMEAVGRLAGGLAHDFNNILTVIDGNAEAGLLDAGASPDLRASLSEIREATERGSRLTRQLLAFSRKQVVQRRVFDLGECVRGMQAMLQRLLGSSIMLRVHATPGEHWIRADPRQLEQVLFNLAVNAREAMPGGGQLHVSTRDADAADTERPLTGEWVLLEVEDDGEGIADEVLPYIFEPFFSTRTHGDGSGLGLATSYAIVEASGGTIEVASVPGHGSRFRIFLPRSPHDAAPAAPRSENGSASGTETILLAEDDAAVRKVVRHALTRRGYSVLEAEHGELALELLRQHRAQIALLVSDVMMPVMGGLELTERVRALEPGLPVLLISGYTDDAPELRRAGSAPLLHKPFTAAQLTGAVRALLDGARAGTAV